jgi:manganese transport protein
VGINLIFGIPLFAAGLLTAAVAFTVLALRRRGYRPFELAVIALLALVGLGFLYLFFTVGGRHYGQLAGGLMPHVSGAGTPTLAVAIMGATVMPHVVYLHSALQAGRVPADTPQDRRGLLAANRWDCIVGLGLAGLVNLAMLCVAVALFHQPGLAGATDLGSAHSRLAALFGGAAALVFGVALMASGLSSSSVGTYAGQIVMAGFMNWRIPLLARRALTMAPSLLVLALTAGTGQVLIWSQVVLAFGIPFALVPLLLISRDPAVMKDMANRRATSAVMLLVTVIVSGMNAYLLCGALARLS